MWREEEFGWNIDEEKISLYLKNKQKKMDLQEVEHEMKDKRDLGVNDLIQLVVKLSLCISVVGGWWQHWWSGWSQKVKTKYALLLKWMWPVTATTWPNVHIKSFYTYFIYCSSKAADLATHLAFFFLVDSCFLSFAKGVVWHESLPKCSSLMQTVG